MRVVLDTNILVSGLLKPYGPSGEIVRLISSGALTVCHDARILAEYRQVLLRPKFGFRPIDVEALLEHLRMSGHTVSASPLLNRLSDPDDEMFLEVALAAPVQHLITGNLSDYTGHAHRHVQVISPSRFVAWYRTQAKTSAAPEPD